MKRKVQIVIFNSQFLGHIKSQVKSVRIKGQVETIEDQVEPSQFGLKVKLRFSDQRFIRVQ